MKRASWRARFAALAVRRYIKPALAVGTVDAVRAAFRRPLPAPEGVRYTSAVVGGVPGEWVEAVAPAAIPNPNPNQDPNPSATLLYLHGGGFVACSPRTHRPLTAALALRGLRVFVPDYRLAPEHPFPAAPQDVLAVYRALRAEPPGTASGRLVLAGDSAGGNLALGLLLALRDAGEALPDAAALFSPALDLTGASASITRNAGRDAMFDPAPLKLMGETYLAGADPALPQASPLLGDLTGLPPLLVHVGEAELLHDDSTRLAQKAREAGVTVDLRVFPGVAHGWQLVHQLPEARESVEAAAAFLRSAQRRDGPEVLDVVIIGAGLSGVGAAVHLQRDCPNKSFALLEARAAIGGTWDLFRYPGIRSDSDMYTLGYDFKPWRAAKAIAAGPAIRDYIRETAAQYGVDAHIRTQHRMISANWSATEARWTVEVERGPQSQRVQIKARFVMFCSGYYSYAQGHRPHFTGEETFAGTLVHPQFWPEHLDYAGKRVVVIGSGATAMTLVPAMAGTAAHVTMLQRSPTYVVARPATDAIAEFLKRWLPAGLAYRLIRSKNILVGMYYYRVLRKYPGRSKAWLVAMVREALGPDFDVNKHFKPHYKPWDQRLCLVPDGDLFKTLRSGSASVVTDHIDTFTAQGIKLRSGEFLPADVVVTATGLQVNLLGEAKLSLDGMPVIPAELLVYKGMMYSGLPNVVNTFGYTHASWTLKADLTARYFGRVLRYMDRHGHTVFTPQRAADVEPEPFVSLSAGYIERAAAIIPKQGSRMPWRLYQNYLLDLLVLRFGKVADGVMAFTRGGGAGGGSVK